MRFPRNHEHGYCHFTKTEWESICHNVNILTGLELVELDRTKITLIRGWTAQMKLKIKAVNDLDQLSKRHGLDPFARAENKKNPCSGTLWRGDKEVHLNHISECLRGSSSQWISRAEHEQSLKQLKQEIIAEFGNGTRKKVDSTSSIPAPEQSTVIRDPLVQEAEDDLTHAVTNGVLGISTFTDKDAFIAKLMQLTTVKEARSNFLGVYYDMLQKTARSNGESTLPTVLCDQAEARILELVTPFVNERIEQIKAGKEKVDSTPTPAQEPTQASAEFVPTTEPETVEAETDTRPAHEKLAEKQRAKRLLVEQEQARAKEAKPKPVLASPAAVQPIEGETIADKIRARVKAAAEAKLAQGNPSAS